MTAWTEIELDRLATLEGVPDAKAAEFLGRTRMSVYHMRRKVAAGNVVLRDCWSSDEDDFIRSTPHFTAVQQAKHLKRAATAVEKRRQFVARKFGVKFSGDTDPSNVGSRRLLARTCLGCGLLLEAHWFTAYDRELKTKRSRVWRNRCTRCRDRHAPQARNTVKESRQGRHFRERMQQITRERATKHGQPWIDSDHKVLRDSSLTVFEKAITLGRTYAAVASICSDEGYTSRVGKGDPMAGAWWIDNPNAEQTAEAKDLVAAQLGARLPELPELGGAA